MRGSKVDTTIHLVTLFLRHHKDYFTSQQIGEALAGRLSTANQNKNHPNNVTQALHSLRQYKVVDCESVNGKLWWYALPEEQDTRVRKVEERKLEDKPRKKRKAAK